MLTPYIKEEGDYMLSPFSLRFEKMDDGGGLLMRLSNDTREKKIDAYFLPPLSKKKKSPLM